MTTNAHINLCPGADMRAGTRVVAKGGAQRLAPAQALVSPEMPR